MSGVQASQEQTWLAIVEPSGPGDTLVGMETIHLWVGRRWFWLPHPAVRIHQLPQPYTWAGFSTEQQGLGEVGASLPKALTLPLVIDPRGPFSDL